MLNQDELKDAITNVKIHIATTEKSLRYHKWVLDQLLKESVKQQRLNKPKQK